jgi:omega-amidase
MRLTVSLAQMEVIPAQPERNLARAEQLIAAAAASGSNLVCFPEMWPTGFAWDYIQSNPDRLEDIRCHVARLARQYRIWINGSMPLPDPAGRMANTSILFNDAGEEAGIYRKIHLFGLLREEEHLAPGISLTLVKSPWGLAGLGICYDIRFPELFRAYALSGAVLVLVPIAFPHPRLEHWRTLARARAIENQLFLLGVNRVGRENFGPAGQVEYFGHSMLVDPWGEVLIDAHEDEETLLTATIQTELADEVRASMPVLKDIRPEAYAIQEGG